MIRFDVSQLKIDMKNFVNKYEEISKAKKEEREEYAHFVMMERLKYPIGHPLHSTCFKIANLLRNKK
jgi:hypothetical protein